MTASRRSAKLDAENRPTHRGREIALLKQIMHPHLTSVSSDADNIGKLSEWQTTVLSNERKKQLDEPVKTATLIEEAPLWLQEHLKWCSGEIGTDYKKAVMAFESDIRSKTSWDTGGLS